MPPIRCEPVNGHYHSKGEINNVEAGLKMEFLLLVPILDLVIVSDAIINSCKYFVTTMFRLLLISILTVYLTESEPHTYMKN